MAAPRLEDRIDAFLRKHPALAAVAGGATVLGGIKLWERHEKKGSEEKDE